MDPLYIAVAFAFGFIIKQIKLPPLLGFLIAGFVLKAVGVENSASLNELAQTGILLLLFSIGLKLNIKDLLKPVIWGGTVLHILITVIIFSLGIFIFSWLGVSQLLNIPVQKIALISFALSFSSTVFVIKILEERKSSSSMYGKIAIGILVMQDIIAVLFLTISTGKVPNIWALTLLPLVFIPKVINKVTLFPLLNRSGHGELLVLLGILIPLGGSYIFEIVGLKPDLGALVFGVLLSGHPKAKELSKAMMSFKDLFLVGFFLTIGFTGLPNLEIIAIALLLNLLLPFKSLAYFFILSKFRYSARTSVFSTLSLTNFSEFGLIVGATAMLKGWLPDQWMIVFALTLSFSFILSSPLNIMAERLYEGWNKLFKKYESNTLIKEEQPIYIDDAEIVVLGMGKVGTAVYRYLQSKGIEKITGIEINPDKINELNEKGFNAIIGDITNVDFWNKVYSKVQLKMVVFTISNHFSIQEALAEMKRLDIRVKMAALYKFDDEKESLENSGIDITYNIFEEAGAGFGAHVFASLNDS